MSISVVLIDDEVSVRKALIGLLNLFCPEVQVIGEAGSVITAVDLISNSKPDLVFLDVEIEGGTGMDVLDLCPFYSQHVIFVTAHNKYAVEAFKYSALDFLQKPIDPEKLMKAIDEIKVQRDSGDLKKQLMVLRNMFDRERSLKQKIVLREGKNIHLVRIDHIVMCQADGSYTTFFLLEGGKIIVSKNIKEYESIFPIGSFVRCHHSYLINLHHVQKFSFEDGGFLTMHGGIEVPVSFRKRNAMVRRLEGL